MVRDFVSTYRNPAVTTEEFKATVEKHMSPGMNLTGDGKMDWFFDEYGYGTALPKYSFDACCSIIWTTCCAPNRRLKSCDQSHARLIVALVWF